MTVEIVTESTPELVEAMGRLIPQLSRSAPALTAEQCASLVAQPGVHLFVFRPERGAEGGPGEILGMLTLATFTIPTRDESQRALGARPLRVSLCPRVALADPAPVRWRGGRVCTACR